jgi:hypothetical protein
MMFSQYAEDITRNYAEGENWRVIPSRFVAMDIDYNNVKKSMVMPNGETLNEAIPKYFQNCFENACAYGRENYAKYAEDTAHENSNNLYKTWNPTISRNLFWNCMFDGGFLHLTEYGNTKIVEEVKYWNDIVLQSYDEHEGMGYGELYCYVPSDGERMRCQCIAVTDLINNDGRKYDASNSNQFLEGYTDRYVENYVQQYYYNNDFTMTFDDDTLGKLVNAADSYYGINTIVVLYDVLKKVNDNWEKIYSYIPMGMYIAGKFDEENKLTNSVKKYVSTSYGTGTAYGLRICTRFTVSPKGMILKEYDLKTDYDNHNTISQLMTTMSECLIKMMDMANQQNNTIQNFKEIMTTIRNNRTNVPYIKDINGTDWWFVNGRAVSAVDNKQDSSCMQLSAEVVQKRLDNLMDNNPDNDFTYISDGSSCDCHVLSNKVLAEALGVDYNGPEYGGGTTGDSGDNKNEISDIESTLD